MNILVTKITSNRYSIYSIFAVVLVASSFIILSDAKYIKTVENPDGTTSHYLHFKIEYMNITRLCNGTKEILSVNNEFPGPTVYVQQRDSVNIKVTNHVNESVSIHWHGIRQMFTNWADGPAYVTQCPLQPKHHFTHSFTVQREQGTLFWHAHLGWQRATLYGAFIIMPPKGRPYPFPIQPKEDFPPLLLGEWWNMNVDDVEKFGLNNGAGYNISDALTINGQPGLLYNCSAPDAIRLNVTKGDTYLLRIINAAMNFQLYFQIAHHNLTVVEIDCSPTKPYTTDVLLLTPGQTADVLVTADQDVDTYVISSSVFSPPNASLVDYPKIATTALFVYEGASERTLEESDFPTFPAVNDTSFPLQYMGSLRSLNNEHYPAEVPKIVDEDLLFTIGYSLVECKPGQSCQGPHNMSIGTSLNNITFEFPDVSILQAYYGQTHPNDSAAILCDTSLDEVKSAYTEDFPSMPLFQYNYTNETLANLQATFGTKVKVLEFNSNVQLVLEDTLNLFFESHPIHLHGYNFYVVGFGNGTYDPEKDPPNFNLVDPPAMNTVGVPSGGWVAIRFYTDNPGVWLMHCHFDMHVSWGMAMAFIVKEGEAANQKLPPPPKDYPSC